MSDESSSDESGSDELADAILAAKPYAPERVLEALALLNVEQLGVAAGQERGEPTARDGVPWSRVGRYQLLERLGRGAMGEVWLGLDTELGRRVALKQLRPRSSHHKDRLRREAQALARLSHPNVVTVYGVEKGDHEQLFIAMELVEGQTLQQWQGQRPAPGWAECVRAYVQAGRGLAAAHAAGLVHRDFKPSNCMIDREGKVKVLDFGLVSRTKGDVESSTDGTAIEDALATDPLDVDDALSRSLTQTGTVVGTQAYMAPEALAGASGSEHGDQFSFCVSLYEAVYEQRPFEGDTRSDLVDAVMSGRLRPAPRGTPVPSQLRRILRRGLEVDAKRRWPSMDTLLVELDRLAVPRTERSTVLGTTGAGPLTDGVALVWDFSTERNRHKYFLWSSAVGAIAAFAGGVWWIDSDARPVDLVPTDGTARVEFIRMRDALVLEHAYNVMETDPTEAIKWLDMLSEHASHWSDEAWAIASETWDLGIASHEIRFEGASVPVAIVGSQILSSVPVNCAFRLQTRVGDIAWEHEADCPPKNVILSNYEDGHPWYQLAGSHLIFSWMGSLMKMDLERGAMRKLGDTDVKLSENAARSEEWLPIATPVTPSGVVVRLISSAVWTWMPEDLEPTRYYREEGGSTHGYSDPSPRGEMVAFGSEDTVVFDQSGIRVVSFPEAAVSAVWSQDGNMLALRKSDGTLALWNRGSEQLQFIPSAGQDLFPEAFSPDGHWLVAVQREAAVILWDLDKHSRTVLNVAPQGRITFSPDGRRLAIETQGGVIIASVAGEILRSLRERDPIIYHGWGSHDEVLTISVGRQVRIWTIPSGALLADEHEGHVVGLSFAPKRAELWSTSRDRTLIKWRLDTGIGTLVGEPADLGEVPNALQVSPDGDYVLISFPALGVAAWDVRRGEWTRGPDAINGVAGFGSEHGVLYAADEGLVEWDLRTGSVQLAQPGAAGCWVDAVAPVALAAISCRRNDKQRVEIWSLQHGRPVFESEDRDWIQSRLDERGRYLAWWHGRTRSLTARLSIQYLGRNERVRELDIKSAVSSSVFHPLDDRLLGVDGSEVREWRLEVDASRTLPLTDPYVTALAYDPDGEGLAYGTENGIIRVRQSPVPTEPVALRGWVRGMVPARTTVNDVGPR